MLFNAETQRYTEDVWALLTVPVLLCSVDQVKQTNVNDRSVQTDDSLFDVHVHVTLSKERVLKEGSDIECYLDIPDTTYHKAKATTFSSKWMALIV